MSSHEAAPQSTPAGARRRIGLRTPSLRRRVTLTVLVLIGAMLVVLVVVTDLVLGNRLEGQLRQRLVDRAGVAEALVDQVESRDLARRLEGEGVSVVLTTKSGDLYAEGPLAGAAADPGKGAAPEAPATPGAGPPQGPGGPAVGGPGPKAKEADIVQQGTGSRSRASSVTGAPSPCWPMPATCATPSTRSGWSWLWQPCWCCWPRRCWCH